MNIGVFGLGYVGVVNVACLSKQGHKVWCTDVKPQKVTLVQNGKSPIKEPGVEELIKQGIDEGRIIPVNSAAEVVQNCDILITCVGTPSRQGGEVNLDFLNNVVYEIASLIGKEQKKYMVFRSTVPPGTTEAIVKKHFGNDFPNVTSVFYPEFLREGSAVKDFYEYGRFVVGVNEPGNEKIEDLLNVLHVYKESKVFVTDYRTAEYAKYIDNGFHALKVAFANEVFSVASEHKVDVDMAHQIFVEDTKLNVSPRYLKPGLPFGGSCLPKDLRELQHLIKKSGRTYPLLKSIIPSNEAFIDHIIDKITAYGKLKISFVGLTFKNYSDDLRESPMLKILTALQKTGNNYDIRVYDEDLNMETVRIDYPYLFACITNLEQAIAHGELLVVSKRYMEVASALKHKEQMLLNLADLSTPNRNDNYDSIYYH